MESFYGFISSAGYEAVCWMVLLVGSAGSASHASAADVGLFTEAQASRGRAIYEQYCVACHGARLADSWGTADARLKGGGAIWTTPSLDAEKGLIYVPVGNPAPDFFASQRPGSNLYTNSMIVLDARTGKLRWYKQAVPHDTHDWDLPVASPLFTASIGGAPRDVVTMGGKDGLLRLVDRNSHEQIYAVPVTTRQNVEQEPTEAGIYACPGVLGGMEWSVPAYNPQTGLMVAPAVDWCGVYKSDDEPRFIAGQLFMGGSFTYDPVEKSRGWLTAVKASTGEVVWKYHSSRPMLAAVTATAGGVLFTGELTGNFIALDASTGKVLYRFNGGGSITGGVISYAVDNKQYVAAVSGMAAAFWQTTPGSMTLIVFSLP